MNRKLLFCILLLSIIQTATSQAKQKVSFLQNKSFSAKQTIRSQNPLQPIGADYFLQFDIDKNDCEKILGQDCLFRDTLFDDPYLHKARLTIFLDKAFITQDYRDKSITIKIKDDKYSLISSNKNAISFSVTNGAVSNLKLIKGNIDKEQNKVSKCQKARTLYSFHSLYNSENILTKSGIYKDEYDFSGLNEYILFAEKSNQSKIMAISKNSESIITAIENLQLCKMPNSDILNIRHLSVEECNNNAANEECYRYQKCENTIIIEDCEVSLFKDGFRAYP